MTKNIVLIALFLVFSTLSFAQKTATYHHPDDTYKKAAELFNKEQFAAAYNLFDQIIKELKDDNSQMQINSEYYKALCSIELFHDDAETLLMEFLEKYPENANVKHVYFQLGKFRFRKHDYKSAVESFRKVDVYELTKDEKIEFYFKNGYANFSIDSFTDAKKYLFEIISKESIYKPSALYYYSHIAYIENNYETALKGFMALREDESFKHIVPYYITHIYYLQENYAELLKIAPALYETSTPKRKPEIARLIGEAYYRSNDYSQAVPYLETYNHSAGVNPSDGDKYEMAFAYYKIEKYEKAIEFFKYIAFNQDSMAQNASYLLAYCYVKVDNKKYALNAFQNAYKIGKINEITEDALYHFAKLSYELDYNPYNQAIDAFQKYVTEYPKALHRAEAMEYLSKMYLSTKNYEKALASIEQIPNKSLDLQYAYQRILYSRGVEMYQVSNYDSALVFFEKSLKVNRDKTLNAKSLYWKAEALYQLEKFEKSIPVYSLFLTSPGAFDLSQFNMAYYQLGYAYFKIKNYKESQSNFRIFTKNYSREDEFRNDALLRIGDCYLVDRQFDEAIQNYNAALQIGRINNDYALFSKAEALGKLGKNDDKVMVLKQLADVYPKSEYLSSAEFEIAETQFKYLNNNTEALKYYDQIIAKYPKDKQIVKKAWLNKGLLYNNMDNDVEAIKNFTYVVQNYRGTEESREALIQLRSIYTERNEVAIYLKLVESLGETVAVTVQDSMTYMAAENIYMKNDCQKASQYFDSYISNFSTGAFLVNAHYYLAECQYRASNFDIALQNYQYVISRPVCQFTENALLQMGYIYYDKRKDYVKALEIYDKLITVAEFKSNMITAKNAKLRCLWNMNRLEDALSYSTEVMAIETQDPNDKIEALMIKAKSAVKLKRDTIAVESFKQVVKLTKSESSAEARYYLALIAFNQNDLNKAESLSFDVIEQVPSYEYWVVKSFILSADIFVKTNNIFQAKATLKSLIDNYTGDQGLIDEAKAKLKTIVDAEEAAKKPKDIPAEEIKIGNENEKLFSEPTQKPE